MLRASFSPEGYPLIAGRKEEEENNGRKRL
jgi:hypothetical protein